MKLFTTLMVAAMASAAAAHAELICETDRTTGLKFTQIGDAIISTHRDFATDELTTNVYECNDVGTCVSSSPIGHSLVQLHPERGFVVNAIIPTLESFIIGSSLIVVLDAKCTTK
ncbi:hypothetical protein [Ruegeria sp. HKCCD7318]|uniref:hypothetical protein n=1 Tax=Ruegeria sp. HKCCD7318 TaxID=2683014 RepID=UPI001492B49D|nr:hypothetical protein [Ruegeria sp. HKCCD7318]NOE33326.1 hypothetical protein [Ruegeria sp. HKCCD7318]